MAPLGIKVLLLTTGAPRDHVTGKSQSAGAAQGHMRRWMAGRFTLFLSPRIAAGVFMLR